MAEPKKLFSVRVNADDVEELKRLGEAIKPMPLNLNQMVGVAVRDYIERNRKATARKGAK